MKTEILISCDDWENRVAVLEEGSLAEIYFEREEKVIGSIYKGRVENVLPGMGACFVNIGLGRNAFLYVDDILRDPINIGETEITDRRKGHTVNELLKVGSEVLVQIVKEPRGLKGARVSTNISLPGRYLVLMPTGRYSGVSSRIEDPNERARLKQIMRRVRPEGMATIVRTAAAGVSEAELIADLGVQLRLWHGILESYKRATPPALLHKDLNLVFKAVRDFLTSDVTAVYIDSKEQYDEIRSTMSLLGPQYINRLKLVDGPGSLFEQRGIDAELQKLLKPKIPLPSGGHLVLEHTEALTVIDVNTGKFTGGRNLEDTIVKTNIEAAAEIARQVRLRDIGGIIVVDFIDMTHERSREQVIATLTEALHRDRTRSTIQAFSKLGLLEFTRKRVGKDLAGQLRSDCPYCSGLGNVMSSETVAIGVLRQMRDRLARNGSPHKLDVVADPGVATQLLGWYHDEFVKLARDHEAEVALYVDTQRHREHVVVEDARRMRVAPQIGSVVEAELLPVRLPNPASGVAEVNSYLIEVKDAANATGQTVKLKIDGVDGNLVRAALAEPLAGAARRRRRDRGRAKDVAQAEAPIAPPTPMPRTGVAAEDGHRRSDERREPAARRRMTDVAFSIADEEEENVPRVTVQRSASSSGRGERSDKRRDGGRRRGGRRAPSKEQQPLVVGGEGDIDYDDGDDDSVEVVAAPSRLRTAPVESPDGAGHKRRRRRGRGKGRGEPQTAERGGRFDRTSAGEGADEEDDLSLAPAGATYDEEERADDDLDSVVDPRRPAASAREPKRFGPIRQLYGRPVQIEDRPAAQRPRSSEHGVRDREARPQPRRQSAAKPHDDDLDVVIKPKGPSSVRVQIQETDLPRRSSGGDHERRDRGGRYDRGEREERPGRGERSGRGERREPREGGRFGRGGRTAAPRPKREGPAVKQLYPPPDFESEESAAPQEGGPKPAGFGRPARGPLMRPAGAAPVQKGKIRQLYPPPDVEATAESAGPARSRQPIEPTEVYERVAFDEAGDEADGSVFVSDAEELDERRRRARERAEARRRAQEEPVSDEGDAGRSRPGAPSENDEWPVF
ncbi:MAG TPA: Rne/Rng family ribonuclease [Candidatus Acidoferrales bacterium]|nr:Rne/Rng family ribonuclease [Candidatus Acidoferrales bacterium]